MKRVLILFVAVFALTGCSQDEVAEPTFIPNADDVYYASFEEFGENSRTYIDENIKLLWHEDDRISLFRTTLNEQWKFSGKTGDNAGGFEKVPSDEWVTGNPITTSYAVYPYLADTRLSNDEVLQIVLPAVQTYAENSFGRGANTMVAAAESSSSKFLPFRNAGGYLVVKLYGSDVAIKSIELKGNNNEILAGAATAEAQYGLLPLITMGAEGSTTITLNCGEGVQVGASSAEATSFWLVVPPVTFEKGFTITITDVNGGIMTKSTSKEQVIVRNEVKSMAAFEPSFEGEGEDPKPEGPANNEIWYTSTDGAVVTPHNSDVFGATITSNTYENGKGVIAFDGDVTIIGESAFETCRTLVNVTLPNSVTEIGKFAFNNCFALTDFDIPNNVNKIDEWAFHYCTNLTSITIPESTTSIGSYAFAYCSSLKEFKGKFAADNGCCLIVNGDLTAFAVGNTLSAYDIPEDVISIGPRAFADCAELAQVTLPTSLKTIGSEAFVDCDKFKALYCKPINPPLSPKMIFYSGLPDCKIYVPAESVAAYKAADGWSEYADAIVGYDFEKGEIVEEVVPAEPANNEIWYTSTDGAVVAPNNSDVFGATITSNTYENGKGVITFDGPVTAIGVEAFYNCSNLTSVIVPEGVTTIGLDAFSNCTSMQLLTLPQSVTKMGDEYDAGVFRNCTGKLIINCNIPDSYYDTSEDEYNIFYSADFTEIVVGDNVTTLGKNAFRTCGKLEALTLGRNISKYGSYILQGCTNLSKIYGDYASADNRCWIVNGVLQLFAQKDVTTYNVPENVTSIGSYAFSSCSSLQSITMPKGLSSICLYAVINCSSLQSIYVQSEVPPTYASYAFSNVNAAQIYIPYASAEAYNVANGWKDLVLIAYDYENDKVYEPEQTPITYDWYTAVTDGVYEIDAPEEMVALSKLTNGDADALAAVGADAALNFAGMTINLMADIDLGDYCSALAGSWTPINTFSGVFNGNNHTISNLYAKTTGDAGLFGTLSSATINDVTVQGVIISSEATKVGGIASVATSAVLENCISQVDITTSTNGSYTCVGGVVGYSSNSMYIACQSTGDISDTIDEWEWMNYVGGIVGNSNGGDMLIACMKSSGNVHEEKTQSYSPVGGILGCVHNFSNISIRSCYTAISITGREPGHITNQGNYDNYNPNANIADCYYSGTPTTSKGVGTRNYGGSTKSFDYGTARSTDLAAEIVIMNEGIDEWNAANPDCICNYKYELDENNVPKLVK